MNECVCLELNERMSSLQEGFVGQVIINIYSIRDGMWGARQQGWLPWSRALVPTVVPSRDLEKKIALTFQRYIIHDAEEQWAGLTKVKTELC